MSMGALTMNQIQALAVLVAGHCERRIVYVSNKTSLTKAPLLHIHHAHAARFEADHYIERTDIAGVVRLTPAGRELAIEAGLG